MLLEFSCSNHKSIKESVLFSAIAGKDSAHHEELYNFGNIKILKKAAIYGANGSGKSNFVDAIDFMRILVGASINNQPGDTINQFPHKLSGSESISEYRIQFVMKNIRYAYGFSLKNGSVYEEYLYYFPNKRSVKVFERKKEEYIDGNKFKGAFSLCKDVRATNRLYLSCAANFSSVEATKNAFLFFKDMLVVYSNILQENWMGYSLRTLHDDSSIKNIVLLMLQNLGVDVKDIRVNIEEENSQVVDESKPPLVKRKQVRAEAKIVYNSFSTDLMHEESDGIRKLIAFLCPYIDILLYGKVLVCDEIETNFHESIVCGLVELLRNLKINRSPQLILTTHDTSILDLDIFRRDEIWFTEMSAETRATQLYSLAEIKNVRKKENVRKGYISGKFGAIPMLNKDLADIIVKSQVDE